MTFPRIVRTRPVGYRGGVPEKMTKALEQAFAEAAKLSPEDQKALASWLLAELASERRWSDAFANSQAHLADLADEARAEHRRGETEDLDPDRL